MSTLSLTQAIIYYVLLAVGLLLLFGYAYEYIQYKTLQRKRQRRRFNLLFCVWLGIVGLYSWISISFVLGLVFIGLAFLCYSWDKWVVDRMP